MKLRVYPDPILTQVSEPVTEFGDDLKTFCEELHTVMIESGGVGLSAVQVGELKRIVVMDVAEAARQKGNEFAPERKFTFINPQIAIWSEEKFEYAEGCLSVPGYYEERERSKAILLEYQTVFGEEKDEWFYDLEAFCIQHELDHLEGRLFIDDLSPLKKQRVRKKIEKTLRRQ